MIWKSIDTGSEYEVSDTGLIRKVHVMAQSKDRDGYFRVSITDSKNKGKSRPVHRLILHAFDPRQNEDELEVHHIDGNPENNNLKNLMWVTHEENISFISKEKLFLNQFIARKVAQYDKQGNLLAVYDSMNQAQKKTGCNGHHIGEVCSGKRKTHGGFIWRYFEGSTTKSSEKPHETGDIFDEDIV